MARQRLVTAAFVSRKDAQRAVERLVDAGVSPNAISVMMSEATHRRYGSEGVPGPLARAAEGATAGSALAGAAGAIVAGVAAVGTIAIPGFGLLAAGPIVAALAGAGAGGTIGGLVGALLGLGVGESEARDAAEGLRKGRIVVAVDVGEHAPKMVAECLRGPDQATVVQVH